MVKAGHVTYNIKAECVLAGWPDGQIICSIFGYLQPWKFPQYHKTLAKAGPKFCQILWSTIWHALHTGRVYWFVHGFSSKWLACQQWPMSGLFLLRLIHITAFSACICGRRLHFCREIENFLSLHWHSPPLKTQTAASSVNQPLDVYDLPPDSATWLCAVASQPTMANE